MPRPLSRGDERLLAERGIGITNFVSRPSARADELTVEELHTGASSWWTVSTCCSPEQSQSLVLPRSGRRFHYRRHNWDAKISRPLQAGPSASSCGRYRTPADSTLTKPSKVSLRSGKRCGMSPQKAHTKLGRAAANHLGTEQFPGTQSAHRRLADQCR